MKYYIALYEKLKQTYMAQCALENEVPLICPSLRVYEREDLELLKPTSEIEDQSKIATSFLKKQDASYQLNTVPTSPNMWDINPNNSLFSVYREILDTTEIKGIEESLNSAVKIDVSKLYDDKGKETKQLKDYQKYLALYNAKLEAISTHLQLFDDLDTEPEKQNWNDQLSFLEKQRDLAFLELEVKGSRKIIEDAQRTVNKQSATEEYLNLVREARAEFLASEKTDVISENSLHNINFIPYDFMDNENGWTGMKLSKAELDDIFGKIDKSASDIPSEILSLDYDEKYITGVELDYQFVTLKRNWFNKSIFNSEYFVNKGQKPISDGQTINSSFKLPAYPKTMMLIKNLKINLDASISDGQISNPTQVINFGPLILKQQLFVNKTSNQKFLKAVTNKETLRSDQMNFMIKKSAPEVVQPKIVATTVKPVVMMAPKPTAVAVATPVATTVKPHIMTSFNRAILVNPGLIKPIDVPKPQLAKIYINLMDSISKTPIYKCSISLKGIDKNWVMEVETNENGLATVDIPQGNYTLETTIDGYERIHKEVNIPNTNPVTVSYNLEREQVKFTSYFLIGMICERIPKTPF